MRISPHFTLAEMTATTRRDINDIDDDGDTNETVPNTPDGAQLIALSHLCSLVLEPIRSRLGCPLRVNSGFRSEQVNMLVRGDPQSQHLRGEAADIVPLGTTAYDAMTRIAGWIKSKSLTVDQAIYYPKARTPFIHLSYTRDRTNRNQLLVSDAPGGSGGPYRPWTPS